MRFRTAILWNGISQFGQSGITLLSTIILARLLTPDDFGLIGIVTIFIAFSQMMVDSEMGGALLRKKSVDNRDYSTLFFYNLAVSLGIYAILYFAAPLISDFYGRAELTGIIRLISVCIIIHAFRVVQLIMLLRALRFKTIAAINITSGGLSLLLAVILARNGFGYRAIIWQQIACAALTVILMEVSNRFIPSLSFSKESFRYQFSFGISLLGANTVTTIANNIATNIIAKISSLQFTGYFSQVSRLTTFFNNFIGALMSHSIFPIMSKYEDVADIRRVYRNLLRYLIIIFVPAILLFSLFPDFWIGIVLGKQWLPASWIFAILSLAILPASIQALCRNVMKTLGTTKRVLTVETIQSVATILLLLVGAFAGDLFIVWAIVIAQALTALIWLAITHRELIKAESTGIRS